MKKGRILFDFGTASLWVKPGPTHKRKTPQRSTGSPLQDCLVLVIKEWEVWAPKAISSKLSQTTNRCSVSNFFIILLGIIRGTTDIRLLTVVGSLFGKILGFLGIFYVIYASHKQCVVASTVLVVNSILQK